MLDRLFAIRQQEAENRANPTEYVEVVAGRKKKVTGFGRWGSDRAVDYDKVRAAVAAESNETIQWAPRFFRGRYRYLPVKSCVGAMFRLRHQFKYGTEFHVFCATCNARIEPRISEKDKGAIRKFGLASDHARTEMNHCVLVVAANDAGSLKRGQVVWNSAYRITGSCSE